MLQIEERLAEWRKCNCSNNFFFLTNNFLLYTFMYDALSFYSFLSLEVKGIKFVVWADKNLKSSKCENVF